MLELRGIEKRFGATVALGGVDLDIRPGEVLALIGENGAGKSTLMNILSGLVRPDAGTMRIDGEPYRPGDGIAHIHQELALAPHLAVAENILMGIEPSRFGWIDRDALFARAKTLLEQFGRADIDPRTRTGSLSLPDQQVVEICRALAFDARVILMDEPTSSLQRANVERLFHLIRQLRDRGIAIVYISHFLEEVREIATRYTVLRDGRTVSSGELASISDVQIISDMVGRELSGGPPSPAATPREAAALHLPEFTLHRGEVLGIAGLVGSGRTEFLRELFKSHPDFGYLSEDRKGEGLALQLSIADNVTLSRLSKCSRAGWIDLREQTEQAGHVMERLRVKARSARTPVIRLSGGNQQKVAFGRLLHQDADVLLLDEPARGIDIGSKSDIYREIRRLADEGKAIIMVSSYLPELFAVCDRIAVMRRGRLSAPRRTSEWTPDTIMHVAIGGESAA